MKLGLLMYTSETSVASRSSRNPCSNIPVCDAYFNSFHVLECLRKPQGLKKINKFFMNMQ